MTESEMAKMICYLADRVEQLEKERCKCNDNKPGVEPPKLSSEPTPPTVTYVTNYDEDEECISCSA